MTMPLFRSSRAEIVEAVGGVSARMPGGSRKLSSPLAVVRAVLRVDEGTREARVNAATREGHARKDVEAAIDDLVRAEVLVTRRERGGRSQQTRVEVIGDGAMAKAIAARLAEDRMAVTTNGGALPTAAADVVVWAREGVTLEDALAANDACMRAGTPVLFAIVEGEDVSLGPLTVPGRTACLACALAGADASMSAEARDARLIGTCSPTLAARVADDIAPALARSVSAGARPPSMLRERTRRSPWGGGRPVPVWPRSGCPACAAAVVKPGLFDLAAALTLRECPPAVLGGEPQSPVTRRRVGVIGGGTAGYFTALALRRHRPDLEITLIESSTIPVIGVGEATTPEMVDFLHNTLGIDELELYREVRPTWKLGIRFFWGEPGSSYFHHPFSGEHLLEACAHAGDQDLQSLSTQLMTKHLSPVLRKPDGRVVPLLSTTPYAYHLDNKRLVHFLHRLAERRGIERIDCLIDDVALGPDGSVDHLRARDGRTFSFDLYVDATGFSSVLMEKALGVPFKSYEKTLVCDRAICGEIPNPTGEIIPYTLAESMDAGWCWNIPTPEEDHRGYVFASSFLSEDEAEAEMRRKNPRLGASRVVRFRSGRLTECWRKNVFAVANSYAFVEPLESTALFMLIDQIRQLIVALPDGGVDTTGAQARVNAVVGMHWDYLRGFLALHYRFNRKFDTPFWRACAEQVDLCAGQAMVDAYLEGAPLTARPDRELLQDSLMGDRFFGLLGIDNVLLGQKVKTRLLKPRGDVAPFDRWRHQGWPALLSSALPHREGIDAYVEWLSGVR